jgi:hypothetical protein
LKLLLVIVAALVAGPAVAWLLVFAGCSGASPVLGSLCGHNSYIPLAGFTLLSWLALAVLVAFKSPAKF